MRQRGADFLCVFSLKVKNSFVAIRQIHRQVFYADLYYSNMIPMTRFILCFCLSVFVFVAGEPLSAQNAVAQPAAGPTDNPMTPIPGAVAPMSGMDRNGLAMPGMPRMNPNMLLRMREQMTFEIQQTQRTLGFVDPSDTQLRDTLKQQQDELTRQLKDINEQLKSQGIPVEGQETAATGAVNSPTVPSMELPNIPRAQDPTMVPGGLPQTPADPNLLIQQRGMMPPPNMQQPGMPQSSMGLMQSGMMPPGISQPVNQGMGTAPAQPATPTDFDQDQAWANSPWTPQPSKELNELKQTVDALRKELAGMKENIKALETQIQLLNRNILLSQPTQPE